MQVCAQICRTLRDWNTASVWGRNKHTGRVTMLMKLVKLRSKRYDAAHSVFGISSIDKFVLDDGFDHDP